MTIDMLKQAIPDYGKDIKLNLGSVLTKAGSPGLTENQIAAVALASAYASKQPQVINAILSYSEDILDDNYRASIKAATAIMAMNNVYYRFIHSVEDNDYREMPAKLRMNILANPGIEKVDFEACSLAVSAINACTFCMEAHVNSLREHEMSKQAIQSIIRIAAAVFSTAQLIQMEAQAE